VTVFVLLLLGAAGLVLLLGRRDQSDRSQIDTFARAREAMARLADAMRQ
jgi:hypothetical protein